LNNILLEDKVWVFIYRWQWKSFGTYIIFSALRNEEVQQTYSMNPLTVGTILGNDVTFAALSGLPKWWFNHFVSITCSKSYI